MGCFSGNPKASRSDSGTSWIPIYARRRSGPPRSGDAPFRRLPSEPTEYPDGTADSGHVCEGAATHPAFPRSRPRTKHRARREHGTHREEENADAETLITLNFHQEEVSGLDSSLGGASRQTGKARRSAILAACNSNTLKDIAAAPK